jgi:hypothetical protein
MITNTVSLSFAALTIDCADPAALPGCGVREIRPGRAAGRTPGDARPCCPLTRRGGRRNCWPSRPHAIRTGPTGGHRGRYRPAVADVCGALLAPPAA